MIRACPFSSKWKALLNFHIVSPINKSLKSYLDSLSFILLYFDMITETNTVEHNYANINSADGGEIYTSEQTFTIFYKAFKRYRADRFNAQIFDIEL